MLMTLSVIHVNGKTQPINSQLWHLVRNWFRPMFSANESLFWYIISARRNFLKGANEPGFIMSKIFDFQMTIFSHTLVYVSVSIQTIWTVWRFNILTFNESTEVQSIYIFTIRAARVILFSVVSVCGSVCLSVCLSVNTIIPEPFRDIITKFTGHYPNGQKHRGQKGGQVRK